LTTFDVLAAGSADAGEPLALGANAPLPLDDPTLAWIVEAGEAAVFAVELDGTAPLGPRHYLFSARPGEALFGLDRDGDGARLAYLAVGLADTRVRPVRLAALQQQADDPAARGALAKLLDGWVSGLAGGLVAAAPPTDAQLVPDEDLALAADQTARPRQGVVWVRLLAGGARFLGEATMAPPGAAAPFPLAEVAWLRAAGECTLSARATADVLGDAALWEGLAAYHRAARAGQAQRLAAAAAAEADRLRQAAAHDRIANRRALAELAAVIDRRPPVAPTPPGESPLLGACRAVGAALGVAVQSPPDGPTAGPRDELAAIAKASRLRTRQVTLPPDWWRQESGPLLGYLAAEGQPVALLPAAGRRYDLVDPVAGTRRCVDRALAAAVAPRAQAVYRPLPDRPLGAWDLIRFSLRDSKIDLFYVLVLGGVSGLLSMAIPIATGLVFGTIIPRAEQPQLLQVAAALILSALAIALFNITRNLAILRVETQVSGPLQAAIWDRLLRLPAGFFREYSAGDLAARAMAIDEIRQNLSGAAVSTIVSSLFSVFNLALLFYYDVRLGLLALLLAVVTIAIMVFASYRQLQYQRPLAALQGKISGLVLQLITGIPKLRVAAAEARAFAEWARAFAAQKRLSYQAENVTNWLEVYNGAWPIVTSMAVFAVVAYVEHGAISTGAFLAFSAAFAQFLAAALQVGVTISSVLQVIPQYERAQPILRTPPEVDASRADPGLLRGAVELSHVAFRYRADGPLILDDVSLQAQPGEFIALVGPSGAGKSSLFRLLLGFELPERGTVYLDGQDLAGLDTEAVRQQIGVVLQSGQVQPGSIFENIVGSAPRSQEDAWEAARLAGLDTQIQALPMGMQTYVTEGGATFSGGQRQLLLIARALVRKPRILLFDEATSALDNRTQAIVSESVQQLQATRIVIAHRLSTIEKADRIYVLWGGKIAQSGTYAELIAAPGPFADLARRQLA
jgi:NHLM bacteriocin system ABC transporter ATP-binding protein